jgi:hypothetical protein
MGLRYLESLKKVNQNALSPQMGEESMMNMSTAPEVDFSKKTLSEQMPQTKSFEELGGTDVAKEQSTPMDWKEGGVAAAKTAAQGGSGADVLGAGLVASGNPYAIGAGLGLMVLSSAQKAKQARRMQEYENAVARADQRRKSIENLANIGQKLAV